jgi:hypothetical protein
MRPHPVRILIGIDTFGLIGGSVRYSIAVSQELARRGHDIAVICGAIGVSAPELEVFVQPSYSAERATSH